MNYFFHSATLAALSFAIYQLTQIRKDIMSTQEVVDLLTAQVVKVNQEVVAAKDILVAKIVDLQAQLDDVGVGEQVDLSGLQDAVQALDDINPDVIEAPTEDAPVEEPAEDTPPF